MSSVVYSVEQWADWMVATKAAQMAGARVALWAEYLAENSVEHWVDPMGS